MKPKASIIKDIELFNDSVKKASDIRRRQGHDTQKPRQSPWDSCQAVRADKA